MLDRRNSVFKGLKQLHLHCGITRLYVGALISLWLFLFSIFLFAAQPKEFFLDGLKKLEQRSHKCVDHREEYVE
jgi:hypothetical protein